MSKLPVRKITSNKAPAKLTPASASRIRAKAKSILGDKLPKADPDSAAGAAT